VACQDLSVDALDPGLVTDADLVAVSVPMHTAARLGVATAARIRRLNPRGHVCFFGLYASLHADILLAGPADSVIGGEFETPLAGLAAALQARSPAPAIAGVQTRDHDGGVFLGRQAWLVPRRDLLPSLDRYAKLIGMGGVRLAGYTEASRGCAHGCLHCPIPPVYGGRLRIVPESVVLEDVRQLVRLGARHITFGDPDFFNGIRHSLRVVEAMHAEHPELTFDATIKIEHLIEHRRHLAALRHAGCVFVVSAVESVQDVVLAHLRKGHSRADVDLALAIARDVGIALRPTLVPFTPWTTLQDYLELLEFVESRGLVNYVDPIQLAIRLLLPRGSNLVESVAIAPFLGAFDADRLSYSWQHPDVRMDRLQQALSQLIAEGVQRGADAGALFATVWATAAAVAGLPAPPRAEERQAPAALAPRLTEPWFC
jgi:radical SAM superfamily enzyme YgiQ (UPF0313 family)